MSEQPHSNGPLDFLAISKVFSFNHDLAEQGLLHPMSPPHINQSLQARVVKQLSARSGLSAFLGMGCHELDEIQMQVLGRGE